MPSFTQLKYILAVASNKNFSKAAKDCNVSQPSLSAQINKLEKELNVIIFDRTKKPIIITTKGLKVIEQAKKIIKEYIKIKNIKNNDNILSGAFHLAVIPSLAPYILPLFIKSFSLKYPKINLKISEYKTDEIVSKILEEKIDGGLLVTPLFDSRIVERKIFYERFFIYASDDHPLCKKKKLMEKDLDTSTIWLLEEGHCFRDQVIEVCSVDKRKNVLKNINFESGNLETLVNLIRKGTGYTLLPELATLNLSKKEIINNLRSFSSSSPTREVSIIHSKSYFKQGIIKVIEKDIVLNLPKNIQLLKKHNLEIINFKKK